MLKNTITPVATLRPRIELTFLQPTSFMGTMPPVGAGVRDAAKKDRPPREVLR